MAPCTGDAAARSLDVLTRIHMHRSISKKLQRGDSRRTSISCTVGVCFTVLTRLFFGRVCVCVFCYFALLHIFTSPSGGVRSIAIGVFVCLRVCLSVRSRVSKLRFQISRNFLYTLPVAVARFSPTKMQHAMYLRLCG